MGLVKSSHPPFSFTIEQYNGLLAASLSATIVSLLASLAGLLVHFLLLWYDHHRPDNENYSAINFGNRTSTSSNPVVKDTDNLKPIQHGRMNNSHLDTNPAPRAHSQQHRLSKKSSSSGAMNRVSLRLIVLACISYNIYSVAQLVVTGITEKVLACRILAYFIVCFDVAGSMFLGLVGLNLVLVFVVNVKHPERFEKYYYAITLLISIFVFVPPLVLKAGRTIDKNDSCWYHFFFEGRKANPFNWLYYYSWLLFASILATVSSIIAIRKVILEKNNFAHTINMLNREEASYPRPGMYPMPSSSASAHFQRSSQAYPKINAEKNSDLFRRVAIRCICYALVPILCKSWGIGIEIAITSGIVVNYPILVIDRFMACIMGFFVSCIYFSDPSVRMVWHDMMIDYKKRYVDQFYYVDITKVIRSERTPNSYTHHQEEEMPETDHRQRTIYTIMNFSVSTNKKAKSNSLPDPVYIDDSALRRPMKYHPPRNLFHYIFSHHEQVTVEKKTSRWFNYILYPIQCMKEKNARWIPMRRIDVPLSRSQKKPIMDDTNSADTQHSHNNSVPKESDEKNANARDYKRSKSRLFEPYSHPTLAILIYWFFVNFLFYRPPYYYHQKRTFEKRNEKGKGKSSGTISAAERNQVENTTDGINETDYDDENRIVDDFNSDDQNQDISKNNRPVQFMNDEDAVLSSSPASLSHREYTAVQKVIPSETKATPQQQPTVNNINVSKSEPNSLTMISSPSSSPVLIHDNQSTEMLEKMQQVPTRPLLRAGSRNRPMSSSLIKSHQEKASQMKKNNYQEVISGRSSSYPLSTKVNISSSRLSSSKQPQKTSNNAPHSFLDQKLSHEYSSYRHIPTIGHLIQSVSPVHSFMSVRKAAASSFTQAPAARPSSFLSGSSSLHSSPVAGSSLSLSSSSISSSSSSPLKQDIQSHTTSGELEHERAYIKKGRATNIDICNKKNAINDKALTATCINTYHKANLGTSRPNSEESMTCQSYISGQHEFFVKGGGLSPPSKQHYTFIYRQGERIPPSGKFATETDEPLNHDKSLIKKNTHSLQAFPDTDKEILSSGVRTILLHIKNDLNIDDETNNHQRKERLHLLVGNWEVASSIYHS